MQQRVAIPCTILVVEARPDLIEYEGKAVERERHSLRIRLPNGHTVEATLSLMEAQKLREIAPSYLVPEGPDYPPPLA